MKRVAVCALMAMTVTGLAFGTQDRPRTLDLAGAGGSPIRFTLQTNGHGGALRAAAIYSTGPASIEAVAPATLQFSPSDTFYLVLTTTAAGDTLELTTPAHDCAATRSSSVNVAGAGLPNEVTYLQDAEITCSDGTLVFLAKQAVSRRGTSPESRSVSHGRQITVTRSKPGTPLTIQAELINFGVTRHQ